MTQTIYGIISDIHEHPEILTPVLKNSKKKAHASSSASQDNFSSTATPKHTRHENLNKKTNSAPHEKASKQHSVPSNKASSKHTSSLAATKPYSHSNYLLHPAPS